MLRRRPASRRAKDGFASIKNYDAQTPLGLTGEVFRSGFFCSCVSFRRPHCLTAKQARPSRRLLKTTSVGEGWRLGFSVKGDGQKTHSRAEKKRP